MISFIQYIQEYYEQEPDESTSFNWNWNDHSVYAVDPDGNFSVNNNARIEHPDAFPHLFFPGGREPEGTTREFLPRAQAWGRIDHRSRAITIETENSGHNFHIQRMPKRKREGEIFKKLTALKHLKAAYPEYKVFSGVYTVDEGGKERPIIHSFAEHEKQLTDMLKED